MGLYPNWMKKQMGLIKDKDYRIKHTEIDSSKVHPTLLSILGYTKDNPAPEKLPAISMPGPGLRTTAAVWL